MAWLRLSSDRLLGYDEKDLGKGWRNLLGIKRGVKYWTVSSDAMSQSLTIGLKWLSIREQIMEKLSRSLGNTHSKTSIGGSLDSFRSGMIGTFVWSISWIRRERFENKLTKRNVGIKRGVNYWIVSSDARSQRNYFFPYIRLMWDEIILIQSSKKAGGTQSGEYLEWTSSGQRVRKWTVFDICGLE